MKLWVEEEVMEKLIEEAKKYHTDEMPKFIQANINSDLLKEYDADSSDCILADAFKHAMKRKYMEHWKVGDMYELNGTAVIITEVTEDTVYCAEVEFDEDDEPHPVEGTINALTPYELKNLK